MNISLISSGTLLEYFDFISFSIMYRHIPFIQDSSIITQFVLGYGFRFLGSLGLLNFTKRFTPLKTLAASIIIISISTLLISILPNYSYSFYILIFLRAIQSLAFAVEFPTGASIFKGDKQTGLVISAATQGYILSSLFCSIIFNFLNTSQISAFGWRLPFLFGGLIGIVLSILRFRHWLNKTDHDTETVSNTSHISNILLCISLVVSFILILKINSVHIEPIRIAQVKPVKTLLLLLCLAGSLISNMYPKVFDFLLYCILLKYAITHSLAQSYFVSKTPVLASINTLSLIFSALFSQIAHKNLLFIKSFHVKTYNISLMFLMLDACGLQLIQRIYNLILQILNPTFAITTIFIINQFFITSMMIQSFVYVKRLFAKNEFLIPPIYNFITFLASYLLNQQIDMQNFNSSLSYIFQSTTTTLRLLFLTKLCAISIKQPKLLLKYAQK